MPIIKTQNGYIYKINKKNTKHKKTKFIATLFLVCMVLVVGIFYAFSKVDFTTALKLNKYLIFDKKTYFLVSVATGQTYAEASVNSTNVKLQDGAGYVYSKNGKYYLIANAYKTNDDADNVSNNIKGYDTQVVDIAFDRLIISVKFSQSQIETLKYSLNMVCRFFDKVSELILSFDRAELLDAEVRQKLQVFKESCQEDKETLSKAFQNSGENIVTYVKIFQSEAISNLSMLIVSQNLSSDMKYALVSTLASFETLQKNIKKWIMSLIKSIINKFVKQKSEQQTVSVNQNIKKYDGINMSSLVVYAPKNIQDLNKAIDCVAGGQSVIINFGTIKRTEYQSVVDYLSGALYSLRAKITRLQNELYVIMPKSVRLATL